MSDLEEMESSADVDAEPPKETYAGKNAHAETYVGVHELCPQAANPVPIPPTSKPYKTTSPSPLRAPLETQGPSPSPQNQIADDAAQKIQDPSLRVSQPPKRPLPAEDAGASTHPSAEEDTEASKNAARATVPVVDKDGGAGTEAEAAFARARERKIKTLEARTLALETSLGELQVQKEAVIGELREKDAAKTVRQHIRRLHAYNEIRDVGQGLLGMIAEQRGVRVGELYEEFGVGVGD